MSERAVVIGLGRSGLACARVLAADGYQVLVVDRGDHVTLHEVAAHQFAHPGIQILRRQSGEDGELRQLHLVALKHIAFKGIDKRACFCRP